MIIIFNELNIDLNSQICEKKALMLNLDILNNYLRKKSNLRLWLSVIKKFIKFLNDFINWVKLNVVIENFNKETK